MLSDGKGDPKTKFQLLEGSGLLLIPVNCRFTLLGYCITQVPKELEGMHKFQKKSGTCSLRTFVRVKIYP